MNTFKKYNPKEIEEKWPSSAKVSEGQAARYNPSLIEKKWQEKWEADGIYKFHFGKGQRAESKEDNALSAKPKALGKFYTLVELPYPSGDLHIGHWFTFVAPDVLSRFKRMQGYNVFFPMGYDAFGLPAENAAIKRNIHPQDWTLKNIETMTRQFESMGTMIDWDHVTITCKPEYYMWNQWIFEKMYEKGIAYRGKKLSNWCPTDQTVLASEHVENGKCWRCGDTVVQKEVEQWFLKITEYAEQLLWREQKGEGGRGKGESQEKTEENNLRPSPFTLNASQVDWPNSVMAAQNDWIGKKEGVKIKHKVIGMDLQFESFSAYPAWSWADRFIVIAPEHPIVKKLVEGTEYEQAVMNFVKEMAEETELERKETDEKKGVFTGKYAKDPFGGPDMPIWLANFALMNFGTGIIRCSGHDERDIAFAKKYGIKTGEAVAPRANGQNATPHDGQGGPLKDSGPFTGRDVWEVVPEVIDWIEQQGIGKRHINYHLHDWSVSRQRYWGTPVPMIHCEKCGIVPVPEKDLPVTLPYDVDYQPKGKPPLASNEDWMKVTCPKCGGEAQRDPETLDTFFDSSWYYYRYIDPKYTDGPFDKLRVKELMPVDIYFGGGEHTLGHTLYARFFTKFFRDLGLVEFSEFAKKRIQHGIVLGPDGNKMSKSKGNVINPDDVVKEFGVDAVRVYLSFMMPYQATGPWAPGAMYGSYRFLKRVWELSQHVSSLSEQSESKGLEQAQAKNSLTEKDLFEMHRTIKKVTEDIAESRLNTSVAALMEWLNYLEGKVNKPFDKTQGEKGFVTGEEYKIFLQLLAPVAPHMTEELWHYLHESAKTYKSIHLTSWPKFKTEYLKESTVTVVIQINGKLRDSLSLSAEGLTQEIAEKAAKESEKIEQWIEGKEIKKVIYVPGKLLNFVVV